MSIPCYICKGELLIESNEPSCAKCTVRCHILCSSVAVKTWETYSADMKSKWKCDKCKKLYGRAGKPKVPHYHSDSETSPSTAALLSSLTKKQRTEVSNADLFNLMLSKSDEVTDKVNKRIDEVVGLFSKLQGEVGTLKEENDALKNQVKVQKDEIDELCGRVSEL